MTLQCLLHSLWPLSHKTYLDYFMWSSKQTRAHCTSSLTDWQALCSRQVGTDSQMGRRYIPQAEREYSPISSLSLAETRHALAMRVLERNMIKSGICCIAAAENSIFSEQQGNKSVNNWKREARNCHNWHLQGLARDPCRGVQAGS